MIKELKSVADVSSFLPQEPEVFVVLDRNVEWVYKEMTPTDRYMPHLCLEATEAKKSMETVEQIGNWLMHERAPRTAVLVAVGGGILTDVVGLAASLYKRGIRYMNFPTTLLAQVDAAIGGKNGVNVDGYKNILGTFYKPEYTFICPEVLKTLPERERKAGLAELLKTFLIYDGQVYEKALNDIREGKPLDKWILKAASIKEEITTTDPFETKDLRVKLNLGHTFAHAIEHEAHEKGDDISHGEAVAIGIILAARLAEQFELAEKGFADRLKADFNSIGLPTRCPYPPESLTPAITHDKKAIVYGKVKFVLPARPGKVELLTIFPDDLYLPAE